MLQSVDMFDKTTAIIYCNVSVHVLQRVATFNKCSYNKMLKNISYLPRRLVPGSLVTVSVCMCTCLLLYFKRNRILN